MAAPSQGSTSVVLNSWKEIAAYLGRGVRTVQRYECELRLPVRRPHGRSRSAVIALSDELDSWLRHAPTAQLDSLNPPGSPAVIAVRKEMERHRELRDRCRQLCTDHREILSTLLLNVEVASQAVGKKSVPPRQ